MPLNNRENTYLSVSPSPEVRRIIDHTGKECFRTYIERICRYYIMCTCGRKMFYMEVDKGEAYVCMKCCIEKRFKRIHYFDEYGDEI